MIDYAIAEERFLTPGGHNVRYAYRKETNDWNTVSSTCETDEYHVRGRHFEGIAWDIGGYLGSVGINLLLDNPDLRVVMVEPVPDNLELIRSNADLNGVTDRLTLLDGAVGDVAEVHYRYVGDFSLEHHAFVGNSTLEGEKGSPVPHTVAKVTSFSITDLLAYGDPTWVKIDCEGGEWSFLKTKKALRTKLPEIMGEAHNHALDMAALLPEHDVTFEGEGGTRLFHAVLR